MGCLKCQHIVKLYCKTNTGKSRNLNSVFVRPIIVHPSDADTVVGIMQSFSKRSVTEHWIVNVMFIIFYSNGKPSIKASSILICKFIFILYRN